MTRATVTIVGLGRRGASIGLALKTADLDYQVIGHDKDREATKQARAKGAVDSTSWNLINACEPADAVILTIPFDQVQETLQAIGHELRPGCVVVDTSLLKQPAIAWAAEYLDPEVHFISVALGTNPEVALETAGGPEGARADLFADSPCCLMPDPLCKPEAVKVAQDLAKLLGATPYFMGPDEYDGLATVVNVMPALVAASLLGPAGDSSSWQEMRRLSSTDLLRFSQPVAAGGPAIAQAAVYNRDTVRHWLEAAIAELQAIREQLDPEHQEALAARVEAVGEAREQWLADWKLNRWEKRPGPGMPTAGSLLGHLFGLGSRRKPGEE